MLFKMIMDAASDEERPIARSFLKHMLGGFAIGTAVGAVLLFGLILSLGNLDIEIPLLFLLAMILQLGTAGGFLGTVIFMSRITNRDKDEDDNDDDDDEPGGGTPAPVTQAVKPSPPRPASTKPSLA